MEFSSYYDSRVTNLAFQNLTPMTYEEYPYGWQDAQDQNWPVELLIHHRRCEEVSEHDDKDHARDHVHQDLKIVMTRFSHDNAKSAFFVATYSQCHKTNYAVLN